MATAELIFKVRTDAADFKSTMAQVRSELNQTQKVQQAANKNELSMRQQLAGVASLERQRFATITRDASQAAASQIALAHKTKAAYDLTGNAVKDLGNHLNVFVGQRLPLVGGSFIRITENLRGFDGVLKVAEGSTLRLGKAIAEISAKSGQSIPAIQAFLQSFVKLGTQAEKDAAAVSFFGASVAQSLIPQLSRATAEMEALAASGGSAGAGIGAMAIPIGIAVVAIAALAAGIVILSKELVELSVKTANWQGKLFDLSQQTGVSVETLNALDIAAQTTGGSIETISQVLVIFQGHLDEAQDATSKMGQKFAELNIVTTDTESSLRSALKALSEMPEGFEQTNTAAELFGRRGGKQMLAILKETRGDIDSVVAGLGDLARVTTEQARAADEFNDKMRHVQILLRGLGAELTRDIIPQLLALVSELSKVINENREGIAALGTAFSLIARVNIYGILIPAMNALALSLRQIQALYEGLIRLAMIFSGVDVLTAARSTSTKANDVLGVTSGVGASGPFSGVKAGAGAPERARSGGGGGRSARVKEEIRELDKLWEDQNAKMEQVFDQLQGILDQADKDFEASLDKRVDLVRSLSEALDEQRQALKELQFGEDSHLEAAKKTVGKMLEEAQTAGVLTDDLRKLALQILQVAAARDELTAKTKAYEESLKKLREEEEQEREAIESAAPPETIAKGPTSAIDQLFGAINDNLTGNKQTAALAGLAALSVGFETLGRAVGQAAYAFVLYGNSGTSVRKFAAEVIASIAQMATIQALWEGAQALAMLALNFFWPDPRYIKSAIAHGQAAAAYGLIAAGAIGIGRGVAGGEFAQGGAGGNRFGGGGGSGSPGNTGGSSGGASPITLGSQRSSEPLRITIRHEFNTPLLNNHITNVVITDAGGNGPIRKAVVREIRRQE